MTTGKKASANTRAYEKAHPETAAKDKARGRIEYDHDKKPPGWACSKCNKRGGAVKS